MDCSVDPGTEVLGDRPAEGVVGAEEAGQTVEDEEAESRVVVFPETGTAVVAAAVAAAAAAAVVGPGGVVVYPGQGSPREDAGLAEAEEVVVGDPGRIAEEQEAAVAAEVACSPKPYLEANEVAGSLGEAGVDGCFRPAGT